MGDVTGCQAGDCRNDGPVTSRSYSGKVTVRNGCPSRVAARQNPLLTIPLGNEAIRVAVLPVVWFEGLAAPTNTSPVSIPYPDVPEHS